MVKSSHTNSNEHQCPHKTTKSHIMNTNKHIKGGSSSSGTLTATSSATAPSKTKSHNVALSKALSYITRHGALKLNLPMASDGYIPISLILACQARNMNKYNVEDIRQVVECNDKQRFALSMKRIRWIDRKKKKCVFVNESENESDNRKEHSETNASATTITNHMEEDVLCIRANQGHSIKNTIKTNHLLTLIEPKELSTMTTPIIHGTTKEAWTNYIQNQGLNKMKRNHIHFASGLPNSNEVISGMRKSSEIHIYVNGPKCAEDGITFYKSKNGVILTEGENGSGILPVKYFAKVVDAKKQNEILLGGNENC